MTVKGSKTVTVPVSSKSFSENIFVSCLGGRNLPAFRTGLYTSGTEKCLKLVVQRRNLLGPTELPWSPKQKQVCLSLHTFPHPPTFLWMIWSHLFLQLHKGPVIFCTESWKGMFEHGSLFLRVWRGQAPKGSFGHILLWCWWELKEIQNLMFFVVSSLFLPEFFLYFTFLYSGEIMRWLLSPS